MHIGLLLFHIPRNPSPLAYTDRLATRCLQPVLSIMIVYFALTLSRFPSQTLQPPTLRLATAMAFRFVFVAGVDPPLSFSFDFGYGNDSSSASGMLIVSSLVAVVRLCSLSYLRLHASSDLVLHLDAIFWFGSNIKCKLQITVLLPLSTAGILVLPVFLLVIIKERQWDPLNVFIKKKLKIPPVQSKRRRLCFIL